MAIETPTNHNDDAGPDSVDLLIERVNTMPRRRDVRATTVCLLSAIGFTLVFGLGAYKLFDSIGPLVFVATGLMCVPGAWYWRSRERREEQAIEQLAACSEFRALGPLIVAYNHLDVKLAVTVERALLTMLPQLTDAHSTLLTSSQRQALNKLLETAPGKLALTALSAMEHLGDGFSLPCLLGIASGKSRSLNLLSSVPDAQKLAQNAVTKIRERIENQNRAGVLLRAADLPGTAAGQLVRPVMDNPTREGNQLLRAEICAEKD